MLQTKSINVKIQFITPILGTCPGNKAIAEEFVASKSKTQAQLDEELTALPFNEQLEKTSTVFPRDEQGIFIWDYQVRGFLKAALGIMVEIGLCKQLTKWSYKRAVDSLLFVSPRRIYLFDSSGANCKTATILERPLRAETMQGERVALARSEELPEGTTASFKVDLLTWQADGAVKSKPSMNISMDEVQAALEYGQHHGIGQWRGSGGKGRFTWSTA